jgi:predicted Zn-dependent peptidase
MYKIAKLKNGLKCITVPVAGTRAVTFLAMVPVGSRYETMKLGGASHFVEHLMFKGTKKRPTTLHISRELDAVGAQFNAFTDKDKTGYWVKIDAAHQEKALDILSDMLFDSKFDKDEVAREKGVIIEEIRMYKDNPRSASELLFESLMFKYNPLGRDIAGSEKGIKAMSRAELYGYYRDAYAPGNMVLVAAGNINKKTTVLIRKYFGSVRPARASLVKDKYKKFAWPKKTLPKLSRVAVETRKIDQAHIFIGYRGVKNTDKKRYALAILLNILGGNMSSRLFVEVREKRGLAYRVHADGYSFRDAGAVVIGAGLNPARLKEAIEVIAAECGKLTRENVSAKELNDSKNNLIGQLILAMENSSTQANWYAAKYLFDDKMGDPSKEIAALKKVTIGEVRNLAAEIFRPEERRIGAVSPLNKKAFLKLF